MHRGISRGLWRISSREWAILKMKRSLPIWHTKPAKTLVNLTQTSNYVDQANELGISVHQIVIDDFCPPSLDQIQQFLSIVDNCKEVCNRLCYQRPG